MSTAPYGRPRNWAATLAWVLLLLFVGAALATWGLTRWNSAAQFLGVAAEPQPVALRPAPAGIALQSMPERPASAAETARLAQLESRLNAVENATQRAAGSAVRADALLLAFASRRAIDRGVALGYLESLLASRFGDRHPRAVAQIITASRQPVTLDQLIGEYEQLGEELRGAAPDESFWTGLKREMGSLIEVRRASTPSTKPEARYDRALASLHDGRADAALAETMRLPGAARAAGWASRARRYIAAHRALDEIESAALLSNS